MQKLPSKKSPRKKTKTYTIEDAVYGQFIIKYWDNPWWKNKDKVLKLITGFKMDCKPAELRILVGITEEQLRYFKEIHPELYQTFEDFRKTPTLKARATVVRAVSIDVTTAFKYLERKEPEEFKERKDITTDDKPILIDDIMNDDEE